MSKLKTMYFKVVTNLDNYFTDNELTVMLQLAINSVSPNSLEIDGHYGNRTNLMTTYVNNDAALDQFVKQLVVNIVMLDIEAIQKKTLIEMVYQIYEQTYEVHTEIIS